MDVLVHVIFYNIPPKYIFHSVGKNQLVVCRHNIIVGTISLPATYTIVAANLLIFGTSWNH